MNDQAKTKDELIWELQELRKENNSLKALTAPSKLERENRQVSSIDAMLTLLMDVENERLAWWEIEIPTGKLIFDERKIGVLGYPPDNFKYLNDFTELIHPDDYNRVMEVINGYMEGSLDKFELEYRVLAKSGEYIWLFKFGSIVKYDEQGKPMVCAGFVYNITERKQVEEILHKNEQMLQTVMDNFPGVIFWKDTQSRYLGCNQACAEGAGLNSPSELIGKTDAELIWGSTEGERYVSDDAKVMESGQPITHLLESQHRANDRVIWLDTSKFPFRDSQGRIMGVIGVSNDITKLKETEQQLIDANNELVYQNQEKAEQAMELSRALKKAEESDRLKSEFLANMSHEIRTPMNSILGFAELLKDPDLTPWQQQEYILIIEKSIGRMVNIITDIVDFSKIEAGGMTLYLSQTDINREIETICDFYEPEAQYKGIRVIVKTPLPSSEVTIQTDRDKLNAILSNLMKNAIKFTRSGSIEIGYEREDHYLEFFVKDTGIGVTNAQKEIIFERFRQGSESENKKYEGAGLGLSISKAYVEAMGGRIWVESDTENPYQKGSVFYFTLPLDGQYKPTAAGKTKLGMR